jgi:hypothetical protein
MVVLVAGSLDILRVAVSAWHLRLVAVTPGILIYVYLHHLPWYKTP